MIRILLVSECCTDKRYEEMIKAESMRISASQFMFSNLLKGLSECKTAIVTVISGIRIPRAGKRYRKRLIESEYGFEYIYPSQLDISILHFLWAWLAVFMETAKWCSKNKGERRFIICDSLMSCAIPARIAGVLLRAETVAYVTDLPHLMGEIDEEEYKVKIRTFIGVLSGMIKRDIFKYDRYVTLTEGLNQYVNPRKNPHLIVECITDAAADFEAQEQRGESDFVVMFAGKTNRLFGMELLLDAIRLIERPNIRFQIFGKGNYDEQIKEAAKMDKRIDYQGVLPHEDILIKEKSADLLVNLRPSGYQFAAFSFPSKVAEYMASGTPVLSTRLPGIPEEYGQFLWYLDTEDAAGVARAITEIMDISESERTARGEAAKRFIENSKNPKTQASRIIKFLSGYEIEEDLCIT